MIEAWYAQVLAHTRMYWVSHLISGEVPRVFFITVLTPRRAWGLRWP